MNKYLCLLGLCFCFIGINNTTKAQAKVEYSKDSLHVAWGSDNYGGTTDISGTVSIISDGQAIEISVAVNDNNLQFTGDPIHSDHIEVWLAFPDIFKDKDPSYWDTIYRTQYIVDDSLQLYLYGDRPDLELFRQELQKPMLRVQRGAGKGHNYYPDDPDLLGGDWLIEQINEHLSTPRNSHLSKQRIFFGVSHLGILPDKSEAIMYDSDFYSVIEERLGTSIADFSSDVSVTSTTNSQGYETTIRIPASGFGFVKNRGIKNLDIMVDIIDADESGKQETILSTSSKREWADPATFENIRLDNPVRASLHPKIPLLGNPVYNPNNYQIRSYAPEYWVHTVKGWAPISLENKSFREYNQPISYVMEHIRRFRINHLDVQYEKKSIGKNSLEYFHYPQGTYLLIDEQHWYPYENILETFLLPDSTVGFLATEYDVTGRYTRQINSDLFFINSDLKKHKLAHFLFNRPPYLSVADTLLEAKNWDTDMFDWYMDEENIDWAKAYRWGSKGSSIILDFGEKSKFDISWDQHGNSIKIENTQK